MSLAHVTPSALFGHDKVTIAYLSLHRCIHDQTKGPRHPVAHLSLRRCRRARTNARGKGTPKKSRQSQGKALSKTRARRTQYFLALGQGRTEEKALQGGGSMIIIVASHFKVSVRPNSRKRRRGPHQFIFSDRFPDASSNNVLLLFIPTLSLRLGLKRWNPVQFYVSAIWVQISEAVGHRAVRSRLAAKPRGAGVLAPRNSPALSQRNCSYSINAFASKAALLEVLIQWRLISYPRGDGCKRAQPKSSS